MSNKLFIIEAPGKLKKIKTCLGSDFDVVATKGHVADLPKRKIGVDLKNNFDAQFQVTSDKEDLVDDLRSRAHESSDVYIATDLDREGEGIAALVASEIGCRESAKRVRYNSITKKEILNAVENSGSIDEQLVQAFEARRILDRLVGYRCSFLIKLATGGPSAGRVQSAALRILAEREQEVRDFVPTIYWPVTAELLTNGYEKIQTEIKKPKPLDISTEEQAKEICERIKQGPIKVSKFQKKEVSNNPFPPFTSDEMYRTASSIFGWKTNKTASVAQSLYNKALCTYHRTDATYMAPEAVNDIRQVVSSYGDEYLPDKTNVYSTSKNAQEAHEACRVVDVNMTEYTSGSLDEKKLYEMIWKRTVASQMMPMRKLNIQSEFTVGDYVLSASGSKLLFDGWRRVWDYSNIVDKELPELTEGEEITCIDVNTERKETQPPSRYSEGSLIKKLKEEGIGRPSTYPTITSTLEDREYIESGKNISVTDLGMKVNDFITTSDFCFADVAFTADMEEKLDKIARGEVTKLDVLREFWDRLREDIKRADNVREERKQNQKTEHRCPKCQKKDIEAYLCLRESRYGQFYSCENYKKKGENQCTYKADVGENGEPVEKKEKEVEYSQEFTCPECGGVLIVRKSKLGQFLGCEQFKQGCKGKRDMDGNVLEFQNKKNKSKKKGKKKNKSSKSDTSS